VSAVNPRSTRSALVFEPLGPEHASALFPVLRDARIWEHIVGNDGATEAQMRALYTRRAAGSGRPEERWINHAVRLAAGPYLGRIEATVHEGEGWAEVAYVFGLEHAGRGYARAAVHWLLDHLEVDEVWACVTSANTRSRRLLEALGFRQEPSTRPLASWDPGDLTYRWVRHR
jgi:RimJ/RimL family protein N-acetyltransferase